MTRRPPKHLLKPIEQLMDDMFRTCPDATILDVLDAEQGILKLDMMEIQKIWHIKIMWEKYAKLAESREQALNQLIKD